MHGLLLASVRARVRRLRKGQKLKCVKVIIEVKDTVAVSSNRMFNNSSVSLASGWFGYETIVSPGEQSLCHLQPPSNFTIRPTYLAAQYVRPSGVLLEVVILLIWRTMVP